MPDLITEARRFRRRILAADSEASARLVRTYAVAFRRIETELDSLTGRIATLRIDGADEDALRSALYREGRLQRLRALVLAEITDFSQRAAGTITESVRTARELGAEGAIGLIDDATPPGITPTALFDARLPTGAVEAAVGAFRSAAIRGLLAPLGQAAAQSVEDAITSGLVRGVNPRSVAREVRDSLGGNLQRALTISRTEMLRAHREGSIAEYRANQRVLEGWVWVSGLGARTCASCFAQHGSVHPIDEPMATHPRCRCVAVPKTRPWADLGVPGMSEPAPIRPGAELFRQLDADTQRRVLGSDAALRAVRGGRVTLHDFVHRDHSGLWGPSSRQAGLREARENAAARRAA